MPTHVVFVINSLVGGGAERALVNIIAGMEDSLRNCRTTLLLLDRLPEAYEAPPFVEKAVLDSRGSLPKSLFGLTHRLRALKPDVVVSFLARANCANVFASKILGYPAIISERVHTTNHFGKGLSATPQKAIIRLFYHNADHVVAVSSGVKRDLAENFGVSLNKMSVIHNPIDVSRLEKQSRGPLEIGRLPSSYVVAMGRLAPNKNFAMALNGFARSNETAPLVILGEGPERAALEALVKQLGLEGRVHMPGYVSNPFPIIAGAKYLISTSNAEGFPNSLVEAMALGCPVISTDCDAGPADILSPDLPPYKEDITHAAYGVLVPVERADLLAKAIDEFQDDEVLENYAKAAKPRVTSYLPNRICQQYWLLIESRLQLRVETSLSPLP